MKQLVLVFGLIFIAVSPALADEACTEKEWYKPGNLERCQDAEAQQDRWKFSIGMLPVGAASMSRPDLDAGFRVDWGIRRWRGQYFADYIVPNTLGGDDLIGRLNFFLRSDILCCTNATTTFRAQDFRGEIGDVYRLWSARRLESFEQQGTGFAASLEYRVLGGLWGAFSFQMSPQYVTKLTEAGGFVRVNHIERFWAHERYNFSHPIPYWEVAASRHYMESEVEHKQKAFQFGFLAKYDLTRDHRHWSVMPQAGVDVLLIRQEEYRVDRIHDWRIFSGEHHPSGWAHEPKEVDSRVFEEKTWQNHFRPVVGLTLELWPGRKWNGIGFVVDARYHITNGVSVYAYDSFPTPYELNLKHRPFTLATNFIVRF